MQKLDRLSKVGIVAIVVLVVFGGSGIWWWSTQPLEPAKTDPPPTMAATPTNTSPTAVPSVTAEQREVANALDAYVEYESKYVEMAKSGGNDEITARVLQLVTEDGPEKLILLDAQRQYKEAPLEIIQGESRLASSEPLRSDLNPASGMTEIQFSACWDASTLKVKGAEPARAVVSEPTLHRVDGKWLVHSLDTKEVQECS